MSSYKGPDSALATIEGIRQKYEYSPTAQALVNNAPAV